MSFSYLASFDICDPRNDFSTVRFVKFPLGDFTLDIMTDVANGPVPEGSTRTTIYNHYPVGIGNAVGEDAEANTGLASIAASQSWASLFQQRMRQAAQAAVWGSYNTLTCTYDVDTHLYSFGYSGLLATIQFGSAGTRRLFGFGSDHSGLTSTVTGSFVPSYVIVPSLSAVTTDGVEGVNYEPPGISMQSVSEFGSVFGLTRASAPIFRDWTQQSEPKAKTLRRSTTTAHPFSHQELFEKSRSMHPFVVIDGFGDGKDYVFKLRPDAAMWTSSACKRAGGDMDDALFDVSYETQVLGVFEADLEMFSGQLVNNGEDIVINEDNNATVNG